MPAKQKVKYPAEALREGSAPSPRNGIPMRHHLTILIALVAVAAPASAGPLTKQDVVRLVKAGTPEEVVIARIREENPAFAMTVEEMLELSRSGVSSKVLKAMMNPVTRAAGKRPAGPASKPAAATDAGSPAVPASTPAGGDRRDLRPPALDRMSAVAPNDLERPRPGWMLPFLGNLRFARCLADRNHPFFHDEFDPYRGRPTIDRPYAFWGNE